MFFKKTILFATLLTPFSLSTLAYADLITVNHTNQYSVGSVATTGICTGQLKDKGITYPQSTLLAKTVLVRGACADSSPCSANLILANSYSEAQSCQGKIIAVVTINDLMTDTVVGVTLLDPTHYDVNANGNTVTISMK